jgi:hypothetical protein
MQYVAASAVSIKLGMSSNNNPELCIVFADDEGKSYSIWLYLTETAAPYTFQKLRTSGWTGVAVTDFMPADGSDRALNQAETKRVLPARVNLALEETVGINGKEYLEIKYINAIGGARTASTKNTLDRKSAIALSARLQSIAAAAKKQDDDSPF